MTAFTWGVGAGVGVCSSEVAFLTDRGGKWGIIQPAENVGIQGYCLRKMTQSHTRQDAGNVSFWQNNNAVIFQNG